MIVYNIIHYKIDFSINFVIKLLNNEVYYIAVVNSLLRRYILRIRNWIILNGRNKEKKS